MLHVRDSPTFLENVIAGVERLCEAKGVDADGKAVELAVRASLARPDNVLTYEEESRREELMRLVLHSLQVLGEHGELIKLQACFNRVSGEPEKIAQEFSRKVKAGLRPMVEHILTSSPGRPMEYLKIVEQIAKYSVLLGHMGDPSDSDNLQSAKDALKHILDEDVFIDMMSKPLDERHKILDDIAHFVGGVRLVKRFKKNNSDLIEDYPRIVRKYLKKIKLQLYENVATSSVSVQKIQERLVKKKNYLSTDEIHKLKNLLLVKQQVISYLKLIYERTKFIEGDYKIWVRSYAALTKDICNKHTNLKMPLKELKTSLVDLALIYQTFFGAVIVLENFNRTSEYLMKHSAGDGFRESESAEDGETGEWSEEESTSTRRPDQAEMDRALTPFDEGHYTYVIVKHLEWLENMPEERESAISGGNSNEQTADDLFVEKVSRFSLPVKRFLEDRRNAITSKLLLDKKSRQPQNSTRKTETQNFSLMKSADPSTVLFNGLDPMALLLGEGLFSADRSIGYYCILNYYMAFGSRESAMRFLEDPVTNMSRIIDFIRINPIYVEILQVWRLIEPLIGVGWLCEEFICNKEDAETQHVGEMPDFIDDSYLHSRWLMNRGVVKMADLQGKRTKSSQAALLQYSTLNQGNQTLPEKDEGTQTRRDAWSCTAKPAVWRYGLRVGSYADVSLVLPPGLPVRGTVEPDCHGSPQHHPEGTDSPPDAENSPPGADFREECEGSEEQSEPFLPLN